jgi:hypothetical protein
MNGVAEIAFLPFFPRPIAWPGCEFQQWAGPSRLGYFLLAVYPEQLNDLLLAISAAT